MEDKYLGTVVWFNNEVNYGFIDWEINKIKQTDLFVHFSDIVCEGFKTVKKGQHVSFKIGTNNEGKPKAIEVLVIK